MMHMNMRWTQTDAQADAFVTPARNHALMSAVLACREKAQLQLLMRTVKLSIEQPFQRLAALTALFLAEAASALTHPAAAMYPVVNRHLLRRASLDIQVIHHAVYPEGGARGLSRGRPSWLPCSHGPLAIGSVMSYSTFK